MATRVLIAGGGSGGLAAALACSRAGADVQLFERAAEFAEVGAGIQLGPNVTRVLHGWGLADSLKAVAAFPDALQVRSAVSGDTLGSLRLGAAAVQRYGYPYATVHRADLHGLLLAALKARPGISLNLNTSVTALAQDSRGLAVQTVDPAGIELVVPGDMGVVADGLWSGLRQQLLNDGPPQATGHLACRAMVRQSDLPQALRCAHITVWLGPKLHVVQYPVRRGDWLNVVLIMEGQAPGPLDSWNHSASAADVQAAVPGMSAPLRDLIGAVNGWRLWPLCARPPLRGAHEHAQGRVALLGDAAHPMFPYLAQGAGMAIEDAAELERCLTTQAAAGRDVAALLQGFASRRWQRNARVQARAIRNGQIFHASGFVALGRDLLMKWLGERLLDMPWLYGSKRNR